MNTEFLSVAQKMKIMAGLKSGEPKKYIEIMFSEIDRLECRIRNLEVACELSASKLNSTTYQKPEANI